MIKRFFATKDSIITNAYKNLSTSVRATGSNMGQADILEIFSLYGNATTSSSELARSLIQFPINSTISSSRTNKEIPASGSVKWYCKLYNVEHAETIPRQYYVQLGRVTKEWDEGYGLDTVNYSDSGSVNWINARSGSAWSSSGGDFTVITQSYLETGLENLEFDVSSYVEEMITSSSEYGFLLKLSGSHETESRSYYTKKLSARGSEFWFSRPILEARWDDSKIDKRNNFVLSSSILSSSDNLNTLYLFNFWNGQFKDIASLGSNQDSSTKIYLKVHQNLSGSSAILLPSGGGVASNGDSTVTGSWVDVGVYSASFAFNSSSVSTIYDVWQKIDGTQIHSGTAITVNPVSLDENYYDSKMNVSMPGLKSEYAPQLQTFRLSIKERNSNPNLFTVSRAIQEFKFFDNAFYKVSRCSDGLDVIPYGTASLTKHTRLSFDKNGHNFKCDLSILESGYMYQFKFCIYDSSYFEEFPFDFRFKIK